MLLMDYFHARRKVYSFLHFLFLSPLSERSFLDIREHGNLEDLAQTDKGGQLLHQFFTEPNYHPLLIKERAEYQRLFSGPDSILVPLWESVYRSKEHLLFDETTFQVREHYHHFGLQFIKENNEPDDHLLIELEFLLFLIDSSLQELEDEPHHLNTITTQDLYLDNIKDNPTFREFLEAQIKFLNEHLTRWIPKLHSQMLENTESLLYKGASMLLTDFITDDYYFLLDLKEELTYESV